MGNDVGQGVDKEGDDWSDTQINWLVVVSDPKTLKELVLVIHENVDLCSILQVIKVSLDWRDLILAPEIFTKFTISFYVC